MLHAQKVFGLVFRKFILRIEKKLVVCKMFANTNLEVLNVGLNVAEVVHS